MKKLISILLAGISTICIACAISGCDEEAETGTFYTVKEAYEKGFLSREQVMSIAYYHNGGTVHNEKTMGDNYSPQPLTPETLSDETENALKQTYLETYWHDSDLDQLEQSYGFKFEIRIENYYGTYNSCIAVMMTDNYSGTMDVMWIEKVADINIYYGNGYDIIIWRS